MGDVIGHYALVRHRPAWDGDPRYPAQSGELEFQSPHAPNHCIRVPLFPGTEATLKIIRSSRRWAMKIDQEMFGVCK